MRRRTLIIIIAIVLLGGGAYLAYNQVIVPSRVPTPTPEVLDDFETVIWASGEVMPERWANLSFPIAGQVVEIPVSEGETVVAGTVLARLDTAELEDALAAAEAGLAAAQADLARLKAGARPGEIKQAEEAVNSAEAARDGAQAQLDQAQEELERLKKGARPAETAQAEEAVRSAQAARGTAQAQLDQAQAELKAWRSEMRERAGPAAWDSHMRIVPIVDTVAHWTCYCQGYVSRGGGFEYCRDSAQVEVSAHGPSGEPRPPVPTPEGWTDAITCAACAAKAAAEARAIQAELEQ